MGDAEDVGGAGDSAVGVLVQEVGGIGGRPEARPTLVATFLRCSAIADVVVGILGLLAGDRGAVVPVVFAAGELAELVVFVEPVAAIRVGAARALERVGPIIDNPAQSKRS